MAIATKANLPSIILLGEKYNNKAMTKNNTGNALN